MITNSETNNSLIKSNESNMLQLLLVENPRLDTILKESNSIEDVRKQLRNWVEEVLQGHEDVLFYKDLEQVSPAQFAKLSWSDYAAIRLLDYVDSCSSYVEDLNCSGKKILLNTFEILWKTATGVQALASDDFYEDMIHLFRQFTGASKQDSPDKQTIIDWMKRHPSGLEDEMIQIRLENKNRIIDVIIELIESGEKLDSKFFFEDGISKEEKLKKVSNWWDDSVFHLRFAARDPEILNKMLGYSLSSQTMKILEEAHNAGIPFFVNPYYASLLNTREPEHAVGSDLAIREYVIYSEHLVEEFGNISAWEKEDIIEFGKPNAAGWLLPQGENVHRRYPDVAILIPNTKGRACAGLCTVCQRMYNFQKGNLNFNLEILEPHKSWKHKLAELMDYYRSDSQLRDILITGGDALMNTDKSLKRILDAIFEMASNKVEDNKSRKDSEKYAEMTRVRLGTRLPVYMPQRITDDLVKILSEFREKALQIGLTQFVIQTHFETAAEITPEAREGFRKLQKAGWKIVNQHVFTTAASRRGHVAKLRQVLVENGVLPYYTFTVKGFMENSHAYATSARTMQEMIEEKVFGLPDIETTNSITKIMDNPQNVVNTLREILKNSKMPFFSTDRNIVNLPGVGKSLAYRVIGLTEDGRRVLKFKFDHSRLHSPIIEQIDSVVFVESKSIARYIREIEKMGEDVEEYKSLYGYSLGVTESRFKLYEYPKYEYELTKEITNFQMK